MILISYNLKNFRWENQRMGKKSQKFAKIYREFTRVKFSKYKLQYPRVRQSEIVAKIIKEWEAMDENAKQNLQKQYIERSGKGFLQDQSSSDKKSKEKMKQKSPPMSSSARDSSKKTKQIKKKPPSPKVRVFQDKEKKRPTPEKNENSKSPGKKSTPSKNQTSSSQLAIQAAKSSNAPKGIPEAKQKLKNEQYVTFYKYYYQRLAAEHPRWSRAQITTIIKLLWKKRHIKVRKPRSLSSKGLSGRQLYNRSKSSEGLLKDQIRQLWRALPHQSKRYWHIKGRGRPNRSDKNSGRYVRRVLGSGASKATQPSQAQSKSNFNWMNNTIN